MINGDKIIEFIESRKQLHSTPTWFEFAIVKELNAVKNFVEKMQTGGDITDPWDGEKPHAPDGFVKKYCEPYTEEEA